MSADGSSLLFRSLPRKLTFTTEEKRALRFFGYTLSTRIANGRPFTCVISDDSELRRLNSAFLGRDYPTDVLSFPCSGGVGNFGDLIISAERAQAQASHFGHNLLDEIRILMLHGVLHLTGMDHENDSGEMERAERKWRADLKLPASLIARACGRRRHS